MLWFKFILGLNFIFFCFKVIIIHYHTQKQNKRKYIFFLNSQKSSVYNYIFFIFFIYVTVSPISNTMLKLHDT